MTSSYIGKILMKPLNDRTVIENDRVIEALLAMNITTIRKMKEKDFRDMLPGMRYE